MGKTEYEWIAAGEEWSEPWGGSAAQWFGSILPRIQFALPAKTILEIGSGFGRWSHYLRQHCQHLHLVDPDPQCMDACRTRFGADPAVNYHLNRDDSLAAIADGSVDFVFSFDSLVHVRRITIETYLDQLPAKLSANGLAFIHHSNLGEFASSRLLRPKSKSSTANHQRDPEMTAALFRQIATRSGLECLSQEIVNWRGRRLIDCFSVVARHDSNWKPAKHHVVRNPDFMREAQRIRRMAGHYPSLEPQP